MPPRAADKFDQGRRRRATSSRCARRWRRWPDLEVADRRRRRAQRGHARRVSARCSISDSLQPAFLRRFRAPCRWRTRIPRSSRRSRRSRTTASCRTARRARSSRRAARSSGCACPRYDGPSVFGALLDRDAGTFRLGPADTMVPAARRYLPGHDDPRDVVGHRPRLADRPRRAARRPVARHRRALHHAPPRAHGLRRRPRPAAHGALRQRLGRGPAGVRPDLRLRPPLRALGVRRRGLQRGRRDRRGLADQADADDRPARRLRGLPRARGHHAARRRHRVRRARVLRAPRPEDLPRGLRPPGQDRRLLAPVARARHVPGPSVAPVPAAVARSR